ncbi:MAG: DUF2851 family protein, partial [Dysgonamonadaceae bacterium]|nr:DUF2851 family protein [Dysgonamonadaceae bacterium]
METLLRHLWKHKLYAPDAFQTTGGMNLEIINPGTGNMHAGPDFFNAGIKLDGKRWAGNVAIHTRSSDWYKHRHDRNKDYNPVILLVVETVDEKDIRDASGRSIPQWVLKIPDHIRETHAYLLRKDIATPCLSRINEIPEIYLSDWKTALLTERLERKTDAIAQLLKDSRDDWNEVFYLTLARHFGFGVHNEAFERLARSLPLKYILKHSSSEAQVEALFLGQAGLLETETITDNYYRFLQREYRFLRRKYRLQPLENPVFNNLRMRPCNVPHIKIVQLAGFARKKQGLFSQVLDIKNLKDYPSLFFSGVNEYWESHYHFEKESAAKKKGLGLSAINILLINVVVPILFAYGKKKEQAFFTGRAFELLESLKPESNYLVNPFARAGLTLSNAGDSQALIQLR